MLIFSNPLSVLEFCCLNPLFLLSSCSTCPSIQLIFWHFQCISLEPKILLKRPHPCARFAWIWTLKMAICKSSSQALFSCHLIFTWIWTYKTNDLTDHQLAFGVFLTVLLSLLLVCLCAIQDTPIGLEYGQSVSECFLCQQRGQSSNYNRMAVFVLV